MEEKINRSSIIKEVESYLQKKGFGAPQPRKQLPRSIDIHLKNNDLDCYFCVMAVSLNENTNTYFDATVSSEWEFLRGEHGNKRDVRFVIYRKGIDDEDRRITVLSHEQVLACSIPHLTSFQIKFTVSPEELDDPTKILQRKGLEEKALFNAINDYDSIKRSFDR